MLNTSTLFSQVNHLVTQYLLFGLIYLLKYLSNKS